MVHSAWHGSLVYVSTTALQGYDNTKRNEKTVLFTGLLLLLLVTITVEIETSPEIVERSDKLFYNELTSPSTSSKN